MTASRLESLLTAKVAMLLASLLAGCSEAALGPTPWRSALEQRRQAAFPREAGLGQHRPLRIPHQPVRIVAGSVLSAEVLLAIAPRERIAGVHYIAADRRYSMVADETMGLQQVGADPEQLLAVRPDLVITDEFTKPETMALLAKVGVPVVRTHAFHDFDDVADNLRLIGWVTGCDAAAEALVQRMQVRLATLQGQAAKVAPWRVMSLDGALNTYGSGSLLDAEIAATGATNLAAAHGVGPYRRLDLEAVLSWRPDALLLGVVEGEQVPEQRRLRQQPGLQLLPCVQREHVLFVPSALLASTSQYAVETVACIQQQLLAWGHP